MKNIGGTKGLAYFAAVSDEEKSFITLTPAPNV
jgi:hypothetical protein